MNLNPIVLSIPVFFGLIAIELLADWISGKRSYRWGDAFGNIACGITEQTTGLLLKVFTVGLYAWTFESFHFWTVEQSLLNAIWLFLGVDFLYYWAHRMSHESNLLWLGHVVHHQSEDYNLSVALRQGALQKLFTAPFYLPLALIGFSPEWFLYILAWNTLYQFWIHTEKIGKLGPLEWILNTPSHHRVHHGRDPKYIDKNHAATLIIWDRLFGTFQKEEERPHYGITKNVGSFNPITAHWKPFIDLGNELKGLTLKEKLQTLIAPPGWRPSRLGGRQYAPEVDNDAKFEVSLNNRQIYLFAYQFGSILALATALLFGAEQLSTINLTIGIGLITACNYAVGQRAINQNIHFVSESLIWLAAVAWVLTTWNLSTFALIAGSLLLLNPILSLTSTTHAKRRGLV